MGTSHTQRHPKFTVPSLSQLRQREVLQSSGQPAGQHVAVHQAAPRLQDGTYALPLGVGWIPGESAPGASPRPATPPECCQECPNSTRPAPGGLGMSPEHHPSGDTCASGVGTVTCPTRGQRGPVCAGAGLCWRSQCPARVGVSSGRTASAGVPGVTVTCLPAEGVPQGGLPRPVRTPPGRPPRAPGRSCCRPCPQDTARHPTPLHSVVLIASLVPPTAPRPLPRAEDTPAAASNPATAFGPAGTAVGGDSPVAPRGPWKPLQSSACLGAGRGGGSFGGVLQSCAAGDTPNCAHGVLGSAGCAVGCPCPGWGDKACTYLGGWEVWEGCPGFCGVAVRGVAEAVPSL